MALTRDKYLNREELKRFLYSVRTRPHKNSKRDYALFAVYAGTGVRATEGLRLRVSDAVLGSGAAGDTALLRVTRLKKKGARPVVEDVSVPPSVRLALLAYIRSLPPEDRQAHSLLFPMTRQNVWGLAKHYARLAGLNPKFAVHTFRHTRAVLLYEDTKDVALVQRELGHARLDTTMIYVHVVDGARRAAASDVGDLGLPPPE
jgi:integrase